MIELTRKVILASHSPRRSQILKEADIPFDIQVRPIDEIYPAHLSAAEVPVYLSQKKAEQFQAIAGAEIVIAADTIVVHDGNILEKPASREQGLRMLQKLSGGSHQVITGVSFLQDGIITSISDTAEVTFSTLDETEIVYYLDHYKPYDKAGAYGIQEWIGMIGIDAIRGSFYTIMGLPIHKVYAELKPYMVFR